MRAQCTPVGTGIWSVQLGVRSVAHGYVAAALR